jgi:putative transcriptional regulator
MRGPSRIEVQLDKVLKQRGKTRYWLAQVSGIHQVTLYHLQKGKTAGIKFETLATICDLLDCEPGDILVRVPDR